jgi:hypothetical protein
MKKFGLAAIAASGLAAAVVGLAAPAQAITEAPATPVTPVTFSQGIDHHAWLNDIRQPVNVPSVNTAVQHSR